MGTVETIVKYASAAAVLVAGTQLLVNLAAPQAQARTLRDTVRGWWRRPVPVTAAALIVVMAVMAVVQFVQPSVVAALERDPGGGWWRCVTALLVQSSGLSQLVFNGAALLAVAPVAARTFGNRWTLVVYGVAGIGSNVVSAAGWAPHGGGNSVAICGLVGALSVGYALLGTRPALRLLVLLVPAAGVALCLIRNNHGVGLLLGCAIGTLLAVTSSHWRPVQDPSAQQEKVD